MNTATASAFLRGEASERFIAMGDSKDAGICEFARANGVGTLRVEVDIMKSPAADFAKYLRKCSPDAKSLKAIGNEAVVCTLDRGERVIGRVRDQAFVVDFIAANAKPDTTKRAAEVVAGNLF
jgi:hypothetical protein